MAQPKSLGKLPAARVTDDGVRREHMPNAARDAEVFVPRESGESLFRLHAARRAQFHVETANRQPVSSRPAEDGDRALPGGRTVTCLRSALLRARVAIADSLGRGRLAGA